MILLEFIFSNKVFIIALVVGVVTLLNTYGMQMLKETGSSTELQQQQEVTAVTSTQVKHYFIAKGYSVCNVTPIKNSKKWFAILVKNREYIIATVFTNEKGIEKYEESIM